MSAAIPLVVLTGLVVVGLLQGRADEDNPALLRYEAWQLFGGLGVLVLYAAHVGLGTPFPHPSGSWMAVRLVPVLIAFAVGIVALLRGRRRSGSSEL